MADCWVIFQDIKLKKKSLLVSVITILKVLKTLRSAIISPHGKCGSLKEQAPVWYNFVSVSLWWSSTLPFLNSTVFVLFHALLPSFSNCFHFIHLFPIFEVRNDLPYDGSQRGLLQGNQPAGLLWSRTWCPGWHGPNGEQAQGIMVALFSAHNPLPSACNWMYH